MLRERASGMLLSGQDERTPESRGKSLGPGSGATSSQPPVSKDRPVVTSRLLLAEGDKSARALLLPWLGGLSAGIEECKDGSALERALLSGSRYHLVIASARLPEPSALQVLARVRRAGVTTPFIVVTSVHGNMLRIFMSDSEGTVLSSRMVDGHNFTSLVQGMMDSQR